ncbi:hypothetical protein D6745_01325 [Candidatus Woesearchaeota archaeon]|nr:MAG: hypothetical protein D6745_01325 [Candidatus Woesearchaeota archaeon]
MEDETLDNKLLRKLREKNRRRFENKKENAMISGFVMGYNEGKYTRPLFPASVFIKVAIGEEYFDPGNEEDARRLEQNHLDVWNELSDKLDYFKPYQVPEWKPSQGSPMGYFEFNVPVSDKFGYCLFARVGEETRSMLDEMGQNGLGTNANILGADLAERKELNGVIIAFYDKWLPEPPPKKLRDTKPPTQKEIEDMMKGSLK